MENKSDDLFSRASEFECIYCKMNGKEAMLIGLLSFAGASSSGEPEICPEREDGKHKFGKIKTEELL
jgi:hypothetical protein